MANNANQPVPRFFLGGSMSSNSDTSASTGSTGTSFDSSVPGDGGQTVPSVQSPLQSMSDNSDDQTSAYPASTTESSFDSSVSGDGGQTALSVQRSPQSMPHNPDNQSSAFSGSNRSSFDYSVSGDGEQAAPSVQDFVNATAASALDGQTPESRNAATQKTRHILEVFSNTTSDIQAVMGAAPKENYAGANIVYTEWMRYYENVGPDACKLIEGYFVEYFSGERWNMDGAQGSIERLASLRILNDHAYGGLGRAMEMYKQRYETPQSTTPAASGPNLGTSSPAPHLPPIPFDYPNPQKYERFYPEGKVILPLLEHEPPSPSGSSGSGSNFSLDSDMMFPLEKDRADEATAHRSD